MSSYEEMVVDREVETAWLRFRVRLADHVAEMSEGDLLRLVVLDAEGEDAVRVGLRATGQADVRVRFVARRAHVRAAIKHLTDGLTQVRIRPPAVDEMVQVIHDVLRGAVGAAHPAFVHVETGDLLLVDPAPDLVAASGAVVELPDAVMATSRDDLTAWMHRAITQRLGREPTVRDDGSIALSRDDGVVNVQQSSTRPIIEVRATVARDVDVRRAREVVARMNADFHFFAFSLRGDRIVVRTTVNARPFCPAHLDRAIDTMFTYLENEAPVLRAKVQRRERHQDIGVDHDLLLIYGLPDDHGAMVDLARELSGDSGSTLGQWEALARESGRTARERAKDASGATQEALLEQYLVWRRVVHALHAATAEITNEQAA